jgi:hypothetical protein
VQNRIASTQVQFGDNDMKKLVGAVVLGLVLSAAPSQAAMIGDTPASNNVLGEAEGWFGANLWLIAGPGGANITVDFIGTEAGFSNQFVLNGVSGSVVVDGDDYADSPPNINGVDGVPVGTVLVASGLINFHFVVNGAVGPVNGFNPLNAISESPNFFVTLGGPLDTNTADNVTPSSGQQAWIALDDAGAGPDDNHDDLVVRLRITGGSFQVPDGGATLTLLGCALMGLGALRRRF